MFRALSIIIALEFILLLPAMLPAEPSKNIVEEGPLAQYDVPDPLVNNNGDRVTTAEQWRDERRPEILSLFEEHVYGSVPPRPEGMTFHVVRQDEALDGAAIMKQIDIRLFGDADKPTIHLLLVVPKDCPEPPPILLGLNPRGNHTVMTDENVILSAGWVDGRGTGEVDHLPTEASRGASVQRWPVHVAIERGYAVATFHCADVDPDYHDEFQNGVHPYFYDDDQEHPRAGEWGTIAAWAWGLSRALDYLETDTMVDADRTMVFGQSRRGKTALVAGAYDERFAVTISNCSGCGGAALSRRRSGESVARINRVFPHWFNDNFNQYSDHEDDLPIDQHMLVALMAPRPVLICSAAADSWADPRGEFLSGRGADPVYRLFGLKGLGVDDIPEENQLTGDSVGYHIRPGGHGIGEIEWRVFCDFGDQHLRASE